jgi:IPT/TIG domain-containing protein
MLSSRFWFAVALLCAAAFLLLGGVSAQQTAPASGARTLLLPRRIVSGERATLAVLDANGRLTPGVTVSFSNGDRLTTDMTGRALFVAPLNPGVVFVSIEGRPGRVPTAVLSPAEGAASSIEVSSAPRIAPISDRIELTGRGFCGDADANQVRIGGKAALVLASSPSSLVVLPPSDVAPGPAAVEVACAKRSTPIFTITFVALRLEADSSPLAPGEHRVLTVHVRGTSAKVELEAHNLAPNIAELAGGNPLRLSTSGGAENSAQFEITGRKHGSFLISIRLLSPVGPPRP